MTRKGMFEMTAKDWENVINPMKFEPMTEKDQELIYTDGKIILRVITTKEK